MKKAVMYLLLAFGITIGMLLFGGALTGFVAGFMDGYLGEAYGTSANAPTSELLSSIMLGCSMFVFVLACALLQWIFLRHKFASYTLGRVPTTVRWRALGWFIMCMSGLAFIYILLFNISSTGIDIKDDTAVSSYLWMQQHLVLALPALILIESTCNLIVYGAVIRELLEWRHQPALIISIYAALMGLMSGLVNDPLLIIPAFLLAMTEGWLYEYSRSVVPIIVGDIVFWILVLAFMFHPLPSWLFFPAAVFVIVGLWMMLRTMEPWKPID